MKYRQPSSAGDRRPVAVRLIVVALAALLIALWSFYPALAPSGISIALARPFWTVRDTLQTFQANITGLILFKQALSRENQALREKLHEAEASVLERDLLEEENRLFKESLGRSVEETRVLAGVLARPNVSPYDTLVIDAGKREGIAIGNLVTTIGDVAVGTVYVVNETTAIVSLFSTPGRETLVFIGPENVAAQAVGKGAGNFEVRLPRGVEVAEGDYVALPGIGVHVFAVVERVLSEPTDPFQAILFKNPVNLQQLRFVHVVVH